MIIHNYIYLTTEIDLISSGKEDCGRILAISNSDKKLFYGSIKADIKVWEPFTTNTCVATLHGHSNSVTSLFACPQTKRLLSGSSDKAIMIWDTESWKCLQILNGHKNTVMALVVVESSDILYSGSWYQSMGFEDF
jgi:WD40 repeat protein